MATCMTVLLLEAVTAERVRSRGAVVTCPRAASVPDGAAFYCADAGAAGWRRRQSHMSETLPKRSRIWAEVSQRSSAGSNCSIGVADLGASHPAHFLATLK